MKSARTPNKYLVAVAVMVPTFIEILDMTVVNVSLNHIQGSLSAGLDEVTWVLTSYLVSNAVIIPISGWLAARIGRRRYLLLSVGLFTASSFACGAAASLGMLVLCRVVQGIAGGGLQPLSNAILLETFPPEEHGTAMAIFGMGIVVAPIVGPILGGWITDGWGWRWIFYVNIPVGFLSILLTLLYVHDPAYLRRRDRRVDALGIALLVVGVGSLQLVLDRGERLDWFASAFIQRLSLVAGVCLLLFVFHELRVRDPVVDLSVFRRRTYALGNLIMFFGFFAFFASIVLLPVYVQKLMGYTSWWAGWVLAPGGIASFLLMPLVGRAVRRVEPRTMLGLGIGLNAYALFLMSGFNLEAGFASIVWPRIVQGIGLAFFFVPLGTATLSAVPREKMGNASAVFNFTRNIGGSFGVAVMTTQLAQRAQFHQSRLVERVSGTEFGFLESLGRLRQWLEAAGEPLAAEKALGLFYREVERQAAMMAVNDVFFLNGLFFLFTLGLVVLLRKARAAGAGQAGAH